MISHSDPVCEFFTNCNVSIIVDIEWRGPKSSPTPFPSGRVVFVCLWEGWGVGGGGRNGDRAKKREREREKTEVKEGIKSQKDRRWCKISCVFSGSSLESSGRSGRWRSCSGYQSQT